jgi:FAD/FMN-containing dehydrogenase/Fe-S oxidoreductase
MVALLRPAVERRLKAGLKGEAHFDLFTRGRYATDASFYQVMPMAVVMPRDVADVRHTIRIAGEEGVALLPRGAGTSQCGQAVNEAIVVDTSKYLNRFVSFDVDTARCVVEPGLVLDDLNRMLKPHGLWFPVDVSTASRATIGGMGGNNSCGTRSIRYGTMRDNVSAIDAILANGEEMHFGCVNRDWVRSNRRTTDMALAYELLSLGEREREEIDRRFPKLMRRVGGYNIDALVPSDSTANLAHLLVGSEGTLAFSTRLELKLAPILRNRVMGVCHFPSFHAAMESTQHIVRLEPTAVELIDRTLIDLALDIPLFRSTVERFVRGEPEAILLVEFAEIDQGENLRRLNRLSELIGDLGFAWSEPEAWRGGVINAVDDEFQAAITEVRQSSLNIVMSMKTEGKPVSFVEDCAVHLEHLADYTANLMEIFEKYGVRGTWYAHASVGCLHVRPILNLKLDEDVRKMRAIAEEAFALVRAYEGSHSGEHGDGILRSEFAEAMFGTRMVGNFKEVKERFDPQGIFNPGRIVDAPKMDERRLFRYHGHYSVPEFQTELDWSAFTGAGGGFQGAVEMCNGNGACRKLEGGVMCPSYRATRNERDLTRGRANTLRLAISGQLGPNALTSREMTETLKLCVSCKACRRECPTGVDMAKMKIEVMAGQARRHGVSLGARVVAWLPRYAPLASRLSWISNLRDQLPGAAVVTEKVLGLSARRKLPVWRRDAYRPKSCTGQGPEVVLFADTFNTYFEPDNLRAAARVLAAGGRRVVHSSPISGKRPLCCGRTFLATGLVEEARREAQRLVDALLPYARRGVPIIGLEPSCLLTLRDELLAILPGQQAELIASCAKMLEEFLVEVNIPLSLKPVARKALIHGHCHQKAFDALRPVEAVLKRIPELEVETIASSCCGMAGAFGYGADTYNISLALGELDLLPAIRKADADVLVVADGFSCRRQIADAARRQSLHVARVLDRALATA